MKVDKLSRLLEAFGQANQNSPVRRATSTESESVAASRNSSAVALAPGFGSSESSEAKSQSRSERVQELKSQVQSGTYKPDSYAVAEAVAKELL